MCSIYPLRKIAAGIALAVGLAWAQPGLGQALDLRKLFQEGIPPSPFADVAYRYANAMLDKGRDVYGPQETGLFLDLLDRKSLSPLETLPPAPAGIASESRRVGGANLQNHENLLRLLYFLSELSGEDRYAQAADGALKGMLLSTPSPVTGLLPWGEHLSWDVMADDVVSLSARRLHEFSRPWILWERCFALAPEETRQLALGLWRFHVVDHSAGDMSSIAGFDGAERPPVICSARAAGFLIRAWAAAYAHTNSEEFLQAIDHVLRRCEKGLDSTGSQVGWDEDAGGYLSALSLLSLAIDSDGAARRVPEPLRTRLVRLATCIDDRFCSLPHDIEKQGFALAADSTASPCADAFTPSWDASRGGRATTAAVATMCGSRYENTGRVAYRKLVVAAADRYGASLPSQEVDVWPMTLGHAINVQLAAFRYTARAEYHGRAVMLAAFAEDQFFGDSPLPRASRKSNHFESGTGADTLALALAELHLVTRHITAVRALANTLDR
ncbi:MAG: hypothetical protein ACYC6N_20355 [Pirellulaceae bacterium]